MNIILFPARQKTILTWISEFEAYYFTCRCRTPKSESTWKGDYLKVFKNLPLQQPLSSQVVYDLITSTQPDSRNRKRYCIALAALCKFAGIPIELKSLKGRYSTKSVKPRELPDDSTIVAYYSEIPNPNWQWAYGMIATYGLRPHELFHLDHNRLGSHGQVYITEGKTGARLIFPFRPEWIQTFKLYDVNPPQVSGRDNSEIGSRVSRAFARYKIPFPAYSLRHAWAIRTMEFGLDRSLAALQMGHSVAVHTDIYHRWISEQRQVDAYKSLIARVEDFFDYLEV